MQWILKDINKKTGKKNFKKRFSQVFNWKKRADDHNSNVYIFTTIQGMTLTKMSFESLWCHLSINTKIFGIFKFGSL